MVEREYDPAGPVLVGVDGSQNAYHAVKWAAAEAAVRGRPLLLLHAKEWPVLGAPMWPVWGFDLQAALDEGAASILDKATAQASEEAPGIEIRQKSGNGSAAAILLQVAEKASMVVVGRRGTGGFGNLMLGSVALHVSRHAACPVAVVPAPRAKSDLPPQRRIVTGVDGSDHSQITLQWAFEEASLRRLPLLVVRAWYRPSFATPALGVPFAPLDSDLVAEQERVLGETIAGWAEKYPDVIASRSVQGKHPVRALLEASQGAELLVVGARGENAFVGMLLGSVSESLVRHAQCPVLVARAR